MEWSINPLNTRAGSRIVVQGDCDLYGAPAFAAAMLALMERGERCLRFDFSSVAYLDSSGVGAIIKIVQAGRRCGADIAFSGLRGTPRTVLRLSNVISLLREID